MNHNARIDRLRDRLVQDGIDQLMVSDLLNVRWLTGFTGSNATVVVDAERLVLVTDSRYRDQAELQVPDAVDVLVAGSTEGDRVNDHIARLGAAHPTLGFESDHLTVSAFDALRAILDEADGPVEMHPTENVIADLRRKKDDDEIAALARACAIADDSLTAVLPHFRYGTSERQFARHLEWEMAERGSERPSFETIVASGPNAAMPHARPSDRLLENGDLVVIDFGATIEGYGSDMTRTLVVGGEPSDEQQAWYHNVHAAQQLGVQTAAVGNGLRHIHDATLEHLTASGQAGVYQHGTGHGVGLFIHENPILSVRAEGEVEAGMALTVEPGAYVAGVGGIRVEDLIVTGEDGPHTLTQFPKGLTAGGQLRGTAPR